MVVGGDDGFHRLLKVKVLEIRGTSVKLGFEVDPDVPVHRSEVWERIHATGRPDSLMDGPARSLVGYGALSRFSGAT